jgi:hypothetical protein
MEPSKTGVAEKPEQIEIRKLDEIKTTRRAPPPP